MAMSISVIIPVYNRAHLIGATIDSLLAQSHPPDEIVVVDDGSTDGTPDVVESYGGRVNLVRQRNNRGPGAARNAGLALATGTHVVFFDSDDLATPDYLQARVEVAQKTKAQIIYGAWAPVYLEDAICRHDGFARQSRAVRGSALSAFLRSWVLLLQNCLIETKLVRQVGGYPEDLITGEDMLLLFRLLRAGATLAFAPGPLLLVRQHPEGQISASSDLAQLRAREELIMTSRVIEELGSLSQCYSSSLRVWRARRSASLGRMMKNDPKIYEEFGSLSRSDCIAGSLWLFRRRVEAALSKRIAGHRIPKILVPAPIQESQIERIRSLGLRVERVSEL